MRNQGSQKWKSLVVKLVNLNHFESIKLSPTINISHGHIHKIKYVTRCFVKQITERKVEMSLCQKYEGFC